MSLVLWGLTVLYVSVSFWVLGMGYSDQKRATDSDYKHVVVVALIWPVFFIKEVLVGIHYSLTK